MVKEEIVKVYDTLLAVPGMNENVKVDLKLTRKQILLLSQVIEQGLQQKEGGIAILLSVLPKETATEIKTVADECLAKAGLTELNDKLKIFALEK